MPDKQHSKRGWHRRNESPYPALPDFLVHRTPAHLAGILIVLFVIGAMVAGRARAPRRKALDRRPPFVAAREVEVLRIGVERFRNDCGRYPTTEEGLVSLINNPGVAEWGGPYVTMIKRDPWTNHYVYACDPTNLVLLSCGPDRLAGTQDDVRPETVSDRTGVTRLSERVCEYEGGSSEPRN